MLQRLHIKGQRKLTLNFVEVSGTQIRACYKLDYCRRGFAETRQFDIQNENEIENLATLDDFTDCELRLLF